MKESYDAFACGVVVMMDLQNKKNNKKKVWLYLILHRLLLIIRQYIYTNYYTRTIFLPLPIPHKITLHNLNKYTLSVGRIKKTLQNIEIVK
jgi:hypothetical protein